MRRKPIDVELGFIPARQIGQHLACAQAMYGKEASSGRCSKCMLANSGLRTRIFQLWPDRHLPRADENLKPWPEQAEMTVRHALRTNRFCFPAPETAPDEDDHEEDDEDDEDEDAVAATPPVVLVSLMEPARTSRKRSRRSRSRCSRRCRTCSPQLVQPTACSSHISFSTDIDDDDEDRAAW